MRPVLSLTLLLATGATTLSQPIQRVGLDAVEGLSRAVTVRDQALLHTTQLFPSAEAGERPASATGQLASALARLDAILAAVGVDRSRVVKLNVYVDTTTTADSVRATLAEAFGPTTLPAVSYVTTVLPRAEAKLALDAVVAIDQPGDPAPPTFGSLTGGSGRSGPSDWAILSRGDVVYISGQAEPGDLPTATRATLASLLRTLRDRGLDRQHIVSLKCFLQPMARVATVDAEIERFFDAAPICPVSHVEWISGSRPIEIELVAWAPPSEAADTVTYSAPPWMTTSPVFSRVARIRGDRRTYVSGLYAPAKGDPAGDAKAVFATLADVLAASGSDLRHLAKATYYVADDAASRRLNEIRPGLYDPERPPAASKALVHGVARDGRTLTLDMIAAPATEE